MIAARRPELTRAVRRQGRELTSTSSGRPRHIYALWALALAGLLGAGIAANAVLHHQAARWRDRNPAFHWAEAERMVEERDYVGAKLELDRALALAPERPEPHEVSGGLHYALQQWDQALAAYRQAIAMGGRNPHLHGRALWCLVHLGRYEEAAELGVAALEKGIEAPNLRRYVADAYRRAGKPERAIQFYKAALLETPNNLDLMKRLAAAYLAAGQTAKADDMLQRVDEASAQLESLLAPGE